MRTKLLIPFLFAIGVHAEPKNVTWTGWFSDLSCASARAADRLLTSTNPECSKRCIESGVAPAFISEQAKAVYTVKGASNVVDQLGFHVEIQGIIDEDTHTLTVQQIKQLGYDGAACSRPKKPRS